MILPSLVVPASSIIGNMRLIISSGYSLDAVLAVLCLSGIIAILILVFLKKPMMCYNSTASKFYTGVMVKITSATAYNFALPVTAVKSFILQALGVIAVKGVLFIKIS